MGIQSSSHNMTRVYSILRECYSKWHFSRNRDNRLSLEMERYRQAPLKRCVQKITRIANSGAVAEIGTAIK